MKLCSNAMLVHRHLLHKYSLMCQVILLKSPRVPVKVMIFKKKRKRAVNLGKRKFMNRKKI